MAYRIVTPRLHLRSWQAGDAPALHDAVLGSLEHLRPWMVWAPLEPISLVDRATFVAKAHDDFIAGRDFIYGIFDPGETRVLGATGLHTRLGPGAREIGYWLRPEEEGRGLASEAAAALTRVAFELDRVARVEIHCAPDNRRSAAVPRRLGYRLVTAEPRMVWAMTADVVAGSPAARQPYQAFDAGGKLLDPRAAPG